ncbi:MAG: hypothetical protein E7062_04315 [Spirochaetaceae bacterium]|nr:hypothetical protein [Spirochaetaceae bacterium]
MKRSLVFMLLVSALALVVPFPGRLAFGIVVILFTYLISLTLIGTKVLLQKFVFGDSEPFFMLFLTIFYTLLFKQLLCFFSPVINLTLDFTFYIIPFYVLFFFPILDEKKIDIKIDFVENLKKLSFTMFFVFIMYLLRDLVGFGTITLPFPSKILEISLFSISCLKQTFFFTSTAFALLEVALTLCVFACIHKKYCTVRELTK